MRHGTKSLLHPREYDGDGPISVTVAYDELTRHAFATWIRMVCEPPDNLRKGRWRVARTVQLSSRQFSKQLAELVHKGYCSLIKVPGGATQIVMRRRPLVNSRTGSWACLG